MAAGKPVVSTPIHDVKAMFGDIVAIAPSADVFVAACREALAESPAQKAERETRMAERVRLHSWDAAAETIRRSLDAVLRGAARKRPCGRVDRLDARAPGRIEAGERQGRRATSVGERLDDGPTALRKVASAG